MESIFICIHIIIICFICYFDIKNQIILDKLTLSLIILGIVKSFVFYESIEVKIIGMGVFPIIFLLIYGYLSDILGKELIGYGDIKFMGAIGFYHSYNSIEEIMILYNLVAFVGFLFIIFLKFYSKKDIKNMRIPFAPIISLGYLLLVIGEKILL